MRWAIWTLVALVAFFAVDRLGLWAESRGWLYWRRSSPHPTPGGSGILADLIQVFQPAQRHTIAERDRQRISGDQQESGAPPLGVDLDRGVVHLRRPPDVASTEEPPVEPPPSGV